MHESMDSEKRLRRRELFLTLHPCQGILSSRVADLRPLKESDGDGREIKLVEKNRVDSKRVISENKIRYGIIVRRRKEGKK